MKIWIQNADVIINAGNWKNKDVLLEKIWDLEFNINPDFDLDYFKIFTKLEEIKTFINNNF